MSGIAALFSRAGHDVQPRELELIGSALVSRGGASAAYFAAGKAGLVCGEARHTRDAQPISGGNGRFALLFDGRLDDRDALCATLALSPADATAHSDAWLAMRAFERWGEAAAARLDGNFAFVVWDAAEKRLVAARDPLGAFPLFYHVSDEHVVVATVPRCIFATGRVARMLNIEQLAFSVAGFDACGNDSVYQGISRLPAAHTLTVDGRTHRLERYWAPDSTSPEIRLANDQAYADEARMLLTAAVRRALRTTGKVACELTGGLDSSAVAVTALDLLEGQRELPVFTHVPEDGWDGCAAPGRYGSEAALVRDIVRMHPRLVPDFVSSDGRSWDYDLGAYFGAAEWVPPVPRWLLNSEDSFRRARENGVTVMLNGLSGNGSLSWSGNGAFLAWLRAGRYATLFRELRAVAPGPVSFARACVSRLAVPAGPDWLWRLYVRAKYGGDPAPFWRDFTFVRPDAVRSPSTLGRGDEYPVRPPSDYRAERARLFTPESNFGQEEYCSAVRSLHGVDYRDPLRDRRLVEWCLRVPEEQFWRHGRSRWLALRVMAGRLPEAVLQNRQRGQQGADWHCHLTRQLPAIREQVEAMASDADLASIIDIRAITSALDDWPSRSTAGGLDDARRYRLSIALPHALAAGRFVRWAKGANL